MSVNIYEVLSNERKKLQAQGECPDWFTTGGYQLFKSKYLYNAKTPKDQYKRIAETAAKHMKGKEIPDGLDFESWEEAFFDILWKGWLSPSTPVLANMGTDRGLPVSCSGTYIGDSIDEIYSARRETAILTKHGFGTSGYFGDIRPRGAKIAGGGTSVGVLPVMKSYFSDMQYVSQGACYADDVEVLTEVGFKSFREAKESGIKLLQVGINGETSFVQPEEFIEKDYDGDMVHFKDSRNIDILVTPNHRMYTKYRRRESNKRTVDRKHASHKKVVDSIFHITEASSLKLHRDVVFNNSVLLGGKYNKLTPYERYLIAFQADGSMVSGATGNLCAGKFHFKKHRKVERLEEILKDCGFDYTKRYYEKDDTYNFYVKHSTNLKTFSWVNLKDFSKEKAKEFLEEVSLWDGGSRGYDLKGRYRFSYSSKLKENIDVLQAIAAICGFKSNSCKPRKAQGNRSTLYNIVFSEGNDFGGESVEKSIEKYTGKVYCATVPFGGLVVRSKGHTLVCGNSRRGAFAAYIEPTHGDFYEIVTYLEQFPDDTNIGWVIKQDFIDKLNSGDKEAHARFQKILKTKMVTGKGYFEFIDKANDHRPEWYKALNLDIKASNLCNEVQLHSSEEYTFTCVLSSMNVAKYREWENTKALFIATVFLDCVAQEFIEKARNISGFEKAVAFTEKSRALGLGCCGLHTFFQQEMVPFESFEAHSFNNLFFKRMRDKAEEATKWLASQFGEPEWCKGYGRHNSHLLSIAPTKSTALIMGGISEGINPDPAMSFTQLTAAGEVDRANPTLIKLMKAKGVYDKMHMQEIIDAQGSVQNVDWLTEEEKLVFRTAFEMDQEAIIRLASARQRYIDQGQSLNLFFAGNEDEGYIAKIHKIAFEDKNILGLYYCYSKAGVTASKGECLACQ